MHDLPPALRPPTQRRLDLIPEFGYPAYDLKSTYCFCAHMHEIIKYFLFTENQEQCLNPSYPTPAGPVCGSTVYIETLHERIAQSVLYLPVDLSMRADCMHEK